MVSCVSFRCASPLACDAGRAGWRQRSGLTAEPREHQGAPLLCRVLPALFCVGRITHRAVTRATHRTTLPPLRGGHPAGMRACHDVARRRELDIVTALPCTAQGDGLRLPDLI